MMKAPRAVLLVILVCSIAAWGCGKSKSGQANQGATGGVPPLGPPQGPGGGGGDSNLRQTMNRIGKGPNSLHSLLKQELNAGQPAWDKIQPQATEYAQLAAGVGKASPAKGSKESWTQLSTAFAESAAALDKAAQARDLTAATAAYQKLESSCMACHREHRGGPGGRGPGGPGRGGPGGEGGPP